MSTKLGPRFDRSFTGRPAHMSPEDREIWSRWWPQIRHQVNAIYFDVGLGEGEPVPPNEPAAYRRMWQRNTQKRADVLITTGIFVWIVELRFQASSNTIGRLLTYKELYLDDPQLGTNLQLYLVTNHRDKDVDRVAQLAGITYIVT